MGVARGLVFLAMVLVVGSVLQTDDQTDQGESSKITMLDFQKAFREPKPMKIMRYMTKVMDGFMMTVFGVIMARYWKDTCLTRQPVKYRFFQHELEHGIVVVEMDTPNPSFSPDTSVSWLSTFDSSDKGVGESSRATKQANNRNGRYKTLKIFCEGSTMECRSILAMEHYLLALQAIANQHRHGNAAQIVGNFEWISEDTIWPLTNIPVKANNYAVDALSFRHKNSKYFTSSYALPTELLAKKDCTNVETKSFCFMLLLSLVVSGMQVAI